MSALDAKQGVTYSQFACIGSGISAIALGATLKRWYGITDVRFFERHDDLGGTWFANTYPGCACDVPSILYSFSFAPNPKWTQTLPSSAELLTYLKHVADKYNLSSKMTFGAQVIRCEWMAQTRRWRLHVRRVKDGSVLVHDCQFLYSGTGVLVHPREPDMPGIKSFRGPVFSAARWRSDVDLRDKSVALVGNGCTAAQIVPNITTAQLTQYIRSKHWIVPPIQVPNTKLMQWVFEHIPGSMALVRFIVFCSAESDWKGFLMNEKGATYRMEREARAAKYIRATAPEKYHQLLIPDFEIGCRRRIYDPGYLRALHDSNITLTDDPIVEVLPDAIRTKSGTVTKTDVIVLANGYNTNQFLPDVEVIGRDGVTLEKHWSSFGGPEAYNCCALNEFPNFFMLLGPNTATGHQSTIMAIENAVNYSLRVIKPILDGDATALEVKPEAEIEYSQKLQGAMQNTVWLGNCHAWYTKETANGKWNSMTYPFSQGHYWYTCLFPRYKDWNYTMVRNSSQRKLWRTLHKAFAWLAILLLGLLVGLSVRGRSDIIHQVTPLVTRSWQSLKQRKSS
ncbi:hypothetical protein HIM_04888 [Hirsutella minnesotensis 3608]|uniref:L-ornithine N(5)-monooxygenase n=1 Tax=Hirsutella minnesotensis 3608 TaxID=1043627 RepID=A0A0F7ZKX2_9HYPO|nr:hypothetical protein HIM_04888 [Hirsutella minnesotensis 3608]